MSRNNNGKAAEAAVQEALKAVDLPFFDWQRFYDSTSARGIFMAQVGDFGFFLPNLHGVIEVKSTVHAYRLGRGAFSDGQRAKLQRRLNAGGKVWVIVWFYNNRTWAAIPYDTLHRHFSDGHASYDCRGQPSFAGAGQALSHILERCLEE